MAGKTRAAALVEQMEGWAILRYAALCYTLPLFVRAAEWLQEGNGDDNGDDNGGGGGENDSDVAVLGLAMWAACMALLFYLRWASLRRRARSKTRRISRPDSVRSQSQGSVRFRLQGGSVREGAAQAYTATWWDEAKDALVLRESRSGHIVLTIPWRTVTRGRLDICDDMDAREPAELVMVCRPVQQGKLSEEETPMVVKICLTDYSDIDCIRACLVSLELSHHRKLWWWLGHDLSLRCAYHRFVTPTFVCDVSHYCREGLSFCMMLAAGSKMLQGVSVIEITVGVALNTLFSALRSPVLVCGVAASAAACLVRCPVRSVLVLLGVALASGGLSLLLFMGSLRASVAVAYPAFVSLESAVLLSGPASALLFKKIPSSLRSATKVFSFDLCHPKRPPLVRKLSVVVRACRYHQRDLPRYIYTCLRDKEVMALLSAARKPATDCSVYRDELYDLLSNMHCNKKVKAGAVESEYQKCDCKYKADVLISYLEAYKFQGWGDVLSSASFHRCHYVLKMVLRRWASQWDVEAAILIAARRGYADVLTTLHTHLVAHHTCLLPVRGGDGGTILHEAAIHGHECTVKRVLAEPELFGVEATDCTTDGRNTLHCAASHGRQAIACLLLDKYPKLAGKSTDDGRTVLHCAAAGGAVRLIAKIARAAHQPGAGDDDDSDADAATPPPTLLSLTKDGRTPLHYAAEKGKSDAVRELLSLVPAGDFATHLEARTAHGWTVLHCATASGSVRTVGAVLTRADASATTGCQETVHRNTSLEIAIDNSHLQLIKLIALANKELCLRRSFDGRTVLHRVRTVECLQTLLTLEREEGVVLPPLTAVTDDGRTVLHCAAEAGARAVYVAFEKRLQALELRTARVTKAKGLTALHCAAWGGDLYMVRWLVKRCTLEEHQAKSHHWDTPLHLAVREGHDHVVAKLLVTEAGRSAVEASNKDGDTPLHCAAQRGSVDAATELLRADADVNARNNTNYTPLHLTSNPLVAELLIAHGANVHALGLSKMPLHLASERGDLAVVRLLLHEMKKGTARDRDIRTPARTPLHYAAKRGHVQVVATLCEFDHASVRHRDRQGRTAMHVAAERGFARTVAMLCEADGQFDDDVECTLFANESSSVIAADKQGHTPLHLAARGGHKGAVARLLEGIREMEREDKLDAKDAQGKAPRDHAVQGGYDDLVARFDQHFSSASELKTEQKEAQ